jgi:adenylate cyclase
VNPQAEEQPPDRRLRRAAVGVDSHPWTLAIARRLRRTLPGDERFGDPLSTAGDKPVHVVAREVSALQPDRPSAFHELGLGALQLWQSLSEASGRGRGSEDVALLFTDLVGFSSWALKAGDAAALELLRDVGVVVERAVAEHRGRIVKRLGDGVMAVFAHPQPAIEAALEAQAGLEQIEVEGHRPRMRAGVHYGRPRRLGGDYLGVDANIAARVGEAAKAGEVLASDTAVALLEVDGLKLGRSRRLKGSGTPRDLRVQAVAHGRT